MEAYTVVFQVRDHKAFEQNLSWIHDNFEEIGNKGWTVSAMSQGDDITRLENIEDAIAHSDLELAQEIIAKV